ncbi:hypothetical protein CWI38_0657p0010, partial [Hamiltosporidium tvaerminnensis]
MGIRKYVIRECKNDQQIPQPSSYTPSTIINNTSIPPSEANTNTKVCLLKTIPSPYNPMHSSTVTPRPDIAASGPNLYTIPISERLVAERQEFIRCVLFAKQSYYNEKFSSTHTIDKRLGIATCLAEPCSLTDTTRFISLREKYLIVVRTRKPPNELVDSTVLDLINRIVGEYADSHVPMTITDIARIIQTAQVCYGHETRKERPISAWKESIEKLSSSQTKSLKKIMREFNLDLNKTNDLSEALQFRKENRMFELFRGRYYRGLSERVESEHVVNRDEIVSFWS